MLKIVMSVLALAALVGCEQRTEQKTQQDALVKTLTYQLYVEFQDLKQYPGDVLCGQYSAPDQWGDGAGFKDFVVIGTDPIGNPTPADLAVFCSEDAEAGLYQSLGISPLSDGEAGVQKIYDDLTLIADALARFESKHGFYPSSSQGLAALAAIPTKGAIPKDYPDGGYLAVLPQDPWGNTYSYYSEPFGGVKGHYQLWTLGRDGKEGGQGADADIRLEDLRYLDHVKAVR